MTLPIINYTPWIFAFSIFQFLWSTVLGIYVWWSNKEKVTNKRFEAQDKRITAIDTSIVTLASEVKHPNCARHADLEARHSASNQAYNLRLDALHGDIRELTGGVKGLTRAVDIMNEFLIKERRP